MLNNNVQLTTQERRDQAEKLVKLFSAEDPQFANIIFQIEKEMRQISNSPERTFCEQRIPIFIIRLGRLIEQKGKVFFFCEKELSKNSISAKTLIKMIDNPLETNHTTYSAMLTYLNDQENNQNQELYKFLIKQFKSCPILNFNPDLYLRPFEERIKLSDLGEEEYTKLKRMLLIFSNVSDFLNNKEWQNHLKGFVTRILIKYRETQKAKSPLRAMGKALKHTIAKRHSSPEHAPYPARSSSADESSWTTPETSEHKSEGVNLVPDDEHLTSENFRIDLDIFTSLSPSLVKEEYYDISLNIFLNILSYLQHENKHKNTYKAIIQALRET